jgi:hypothetical protein
MWDSPDEPIHSLEFGLSKMVFWNTEKAPGQTLFNQFHKISLQNIIDINARMLEADFKLTPKFMAEFDFRDVWFLNGAYWRVNKIKDYNPIGSDDVTTVELYKLTNITVISPYQINIPESQICPSDLTLVKSGRDGEIIVMSSSGQEITEDCCNASNGHMVNGICYLNNVLDGDLPSGQSADGDSLAMPSGSGTGIGSVPISQPAGPSTETKNQSTQNSTRVKIYGEGSYAPPESKQNVILGDNSAVLSNVKNAIIIGDGITASDSDSLYIGDVKLNSDGTITASGINIIDGGENTVVGPFDKTNFIDIIDGGENDVRNPGGDSKSRPIIDGNG